MEVVREWKCNSLNFYISRTLASKQTLINKSFVCKWSISECLREVTREKITDGHTDTHRNSKF